MDIKKLLPFLEEEDLEQLAEKILSSPTHDYEGITLTTLLPFLDDDYVSTACRKAFEKGESISNYLPFMDDDDADKAFIMALKESREDLSSFLPFVSDAAIDEAVNLITKGKVQVDTAFIDKMLPFMDDDKIDEIFLLQVKNNQPISKYLPYVSDDALHKVVNMVINGKATLDLNVLLPFLDDDDIRNIFKAEMNKKA
jgi:hypothetical protein